MIASLWCISGLSYSAHIYKSQFLIEKYCSEGDPPPEMFVSISADCFEDEKRFSHYLCKMCAGSTTADTTNSVRYKVIFFFMFQFSMINLSLQNHQVVSVSGISSFQKNDLWESYDALLRSRRQIAHTWISHESDWNNDVVVLTSRKAYVKASVRGYIQFWKF